MRVAFCQSPGPNLLHCWAYQSEWLCGSRHGYHSSAVWQGSQLSQHHTGFDQVAIIVLRYTINTLPLIRSTSTRLRPMGQPGLCREQFPTANPISAGMAVSMAGHWFRGSMYGWQKLPIKTAVKKPSGDVTVVRWTGLPLTAVRQPPSGNRLSDDRCPTTAVRRPLSDDRCPACLTGVSQVDVR